MAELGNYESFIHKSRYAKWLEDLKRREHWNETVDRYTNFWKGRYPKETEDKAALKLSKEVHKALEEINQAVFELDDMPSMRCLMTAGKALDKDNVAGFNCAYVAIDHVRAFDEILYILMCGTGQGYSVEKGVVAKLPEISDSHFPTDTTIVVADSKIGWAKSLKELISLLYNGQIPQWDTSKIRPKGARLKTFGGRSSGPDPLIKLFNYVVETFIGAAGRKLTTLECHDIACMIADIVVVGGVRRSALICLSSLEDKSIAECKSIYNVDEYSLVDEDDDKWVYTITMKRHPSVRPTYRIELKKDKHLSDKSMLELQKKVGWWTIEPQRQLANVSAVYDDRPAFSVFMEEVHSLYDSYSGERGMFSRSASKNQAGKSGRRNVENILFGTNPCSEIILRSMQFCNLTEVIARPTDTFEDLERKVRLAAIMGTFQSTLTDFRYLRPAWKRNTEEECLLGVSITGIMDHPVLSGATTKGTWFDHPNGIKSLEDVLERLKQVAVDTNKEWAKKLGINQSTAVTCVKPSGTVSQLVNSASGIHSRFSDYYIRRVRNDKSDPLTQFMIDQGVPCEDANENTEAVVFSFPIKSPDGTRADERGVNDQLSLWKTYQDHWCEHKPSATIYYSDDEFLDAMSWSWKNLDECSGISFLPKQDHIYDQAPYEAITKELYEELQAKMPKSIDWDLLSNYEFEDSTTSTKELACVAGACEI